MQKTIKQLRAIWYAQRKQQLTEQWSEIYALGGTEEEYNQTGYKQPIYYLKALKRGVVCVK